MVRLALLPPSLAAVAALARPRVLRAHVRGVTCGSGSGPARFARRHLQTVRTPSSACHRPIQAAHTSASYRRPTQRPGPAHPKHVARRGVRPRRAAPATLPRRAHGGSPHTRSAHAWPARPGPARPAAARLLVTLGDGRGEAGTDAGGRRAGRRARGPRHSQKATRGPLVAEPVPSGPSIAGLRGRPEEKCSHAASRAARPGTCARAAAQPGPEARGTWAGRGVGRGSDAVLEEAGGGAVEQRETAVAALPPAKRRRHAPPLRCYRR
jgi:hypothetical protein